VKSIHELKLCVGDEKEVAKKMNKDLKNKRMGR
jgi:hypothetical protein